VLLLWTQLEETIIAFPATIGLMNMIMPILVVLSPSQPSDEIVEQEEDEPDLEIGKYDDGDGDQEEDDGQQKHAHQKFFTKMLPSTSFGEQY